MVIGQTRVIGLNCHCEVSAVVIFLEPLQSIPLSIRAVVCPVGFKIDWHFACIVVFMTNDTVGLRCREMLSINISDIYTSSGGIETVDNINIAPFMFDDESWSAPLE